MYYKDIDGIVLLFIMPQSYQLLGFILYTVEQNRRTINTKTISCLHETFKSGGGRGSF